jgi:hypothetical protein
MAITRKPRAKGESADVDVDALINKGGTPPTQNGDLEQGTTAVVLRLPSDMLKQINACVKARPVRIPRHTWLIEAVHEKLSRERRNE